MRSCLGTVLLALLWAGPALAQKEHFFGTGKAPVFREENMDRKFLKSKIYRGLMQGTEDPNCVQVLGALFTVLAEIGPTLHKRDENFSIDPVLLQALSTQLVSQRFPGNAYLGAMVRRVLIDRKLPDEWLATAEVLNQKVQIIDMGKLRYMNDGLQFIDSLYFTLPALRDRYDIEVQRATSAAASDVASDFRDSYLDRDVAWGNALMIDAGIAKATPKKGKKPAREDVDPEQIMAILHWEPPQPTQTQILIFAAKKVPPVKIVTRLLPKQYLDFTKIPRGKRLLVKGRFWEMNRSVTEVEVRDALLFEDRDWSQGALLANPAAVAACPLAVNDLTGVAPRQPGGFSH
ncbi:MAG: hypothetical protein ACYC8T_19275 [Myxococcaceae bacterium]